MERLGGEGVPFRAVVADSFYGEDGDSSVAGGAGDRATCWRLRSRTRGGTVRGTIGALWEAALAAGWKEAEEPGRMEEGGAHLSATGIGKSGGLWRWRRDPTAPTSEKGARGHLRSPKGCRILPPGT